MAYGVGLLNRRVGIKTGSVSSNLTSSAKIMSYRKDPFITISYDAFWYADETFVAIKRDGVYLWIPLKIVKNHKHEACVFDVFEEIWNDIYMKAKKDVARNNLCSLYF